MKISSKGVLFISRWEAFVPYWYDDLIAAERTGAGILQYREWKGEPATGTLTIGFGHTEAASAHVPQEVGTRIDKARGDEILDLDLDPVEEFINKHVRVKMTQSQFDALCSLVFNIGEGNFQKSTVLRLLNAGNYAGARAAFDKFTYSKGEHLVGLQRRRDAEQALWDEQPGLETRHLPEEGEIVDHPAEVDAPKQRSMVKSTEGMTAAAQTIGGTTGAAQQGFDAFNSADKLIEAKDKAEALGVQPIHVFEQLSTTFGTLAHNPTFWFCLAVAATGIFIYARRRWRMQREI